MSDSVSMGVGTSSNIVSMTVGANVYLPTWDEVRNKPDNIVSSSYPTGGSVGNVLKKTASGMEWAAGGGGAVDSVNGQTGTVVLDAEDVGAQATISDLATIRSGAALGATAVQPESGKGLSSEDYTSSEKTKLAGIEAGAQVNPTALSEMTDDLGSNPTHTHSRYADKASVVTTAPSTLADNTIYNLSDVSTLNLAYPSGSFDCIINLTTASSGTITITFPTSVYQPSAPSFGNGETWSLWVRNNPVGSGGIVTASKAVSAS